MSRQKWKKSIQISANRKRNLRQGYMYLATHNFDILKLFVRRISNYFVDKVLSATFE